MRPLAASPVDWRYGPTTGAGYRSLHNRDRGVTCRSQADFNEHMEGNITRNPESPKEAPVQPCIG